MQLNVRFMEQDLKFELFGNLGLNYNLPVAPHPTFFESPHGHFCPPTNIFFVHFVLITYLFIILTNQ